MSSLSVHGVMSFETGVELLELVRKGGGNVHSGGFVSFKVFDIVNALPHASCIVGVKLSFYFIFIFCRLVALMVFQKS